MLVSYFLQPFLEEDNSTLNYKQNLILKKHVKFVNYIGKKYPIVDRLGKMPHFLPVYNMFPLPDMNKKKVLPYRDLTLSEADKFIKTNRRINVYWSGGIDSTSIIVSFLMAGIKLDQLHITLTNKSIEEYPWFYHNIIDKKIQHSSLDKDICQQLLDIPKDYLNVTGELVGVYFGGENKTLGDNRNYKDSYRNHMDADMIEFFEPMILASPRPIVSISDFKWAAKFYLWWQYFYIRKFLLSDYHRDNTVHFGDNNLFQYWTLFTEEERADRKYMLRKLIFDFTKDIDYFNNKRPSQSIMSRINDDISGWSGSLTEKPISYTSSRVYLREGKYIIE
jgi:hypothetical protein